VIEREADQRNRVRVFDVEQIRKRKQRATHRGSRSAVCRDCKNCPREAPGRREGRSSTFKIVERGLYNWVLRPVAERQERNCRVVGMRCNGGPINDAVSRIPSSTGTSAIYQHLDSPLHT